ncbi:MAG: HTH-type transcriptional regulator CysB, partial [Pseudomonadales bacterium]|nr:HTH-type transcriptional regulator CysB [Pseudomonadales bacterium]
FSQQGLEPRVVFTAVDSDVIKTYVRLNLGVGIIASMAYDAKMDTDLVALDASHLFESSTTQLGFRKGTFLRGYMYEFISLFAPHLTPEIVKQVINCENRLQIDEIFADQQLPEMN